VLTEWKKIKTVNSRSINETFALAKGQALNYASGALGTIELKSQIHLVAVTMKPIPKAEMPEDTIEQGKTIRYVNIVIDPPVPSKVSTRASKYGSFAVSPPPSVLRPLKGRWRNRTFQYPARTRFHEQRVAALDRGMAFTAERRGDLVLDPCMRGRIGRFEDRRRLRRSFQRAPTFTIVKFSAARHRDSRTLQL
jgi:hypothetical protein